MVTVLPDSGRTGKRRRPIAGDVVRGRRTQVRRRGHIGRRRCIRRRRINHDRTAGRCAAGVAGAVNDFGVDRVGRAVAQRRRGDVLETCGEVGAGQHHRAAERADAVEQLNSVADQRACARDADPHHQFGIVGAAAVGDRTGDRRDIVGDRRDRGRGRCSGVGRSSGGEVEI